MIHGGSGRARNARKSEDEGNMVGAWDLSVKSNCYLCLSRELSLDAREPTVCPWNLRMKDDSKGTAAPWSLWMTENMKWWSRTNGLKAILLVSSKDIPVASKDDTRENFGIKLFYPKIRGHVLTPKFGSNVKILSFKIYRRKPKYSRNRLTELPSESTG
jgi:hypothetical protein